MTVDPLESGYGITRKDLFLARVIHVRESDNTTYIRLQNGFYGYIRNNYPEAGIDDVILVSQRSGRFVIAPEELWEKESWVGVVRSINEDHTLVTEGRLLRRVPTRSDVEYEVGHTVEAKEDHGVVQVVSEEPVDADWLRDELEDKDFADAIREEPSQSGPRYADFAGYEELKASVESYVTDSFEYGEALRKLGATPSKGVLFTGDPGTGKTYLARIAANEAEAHFYPIRGPEIVSKWYGQTEKYLRQIFDDAKRQQKAVIFFDELDSIATSRDQLSHDASRSVVTQLLTLLNDYESDNIFVVATTNRADSIDKALKRSGRLDKVIEFNLPDQDDRRAILVLGASKNADVEELPYDEIVQRTRGWTPSELVSIWKAAARCAVRDGRVSVTPEDYRRGFEQAQFERAEVLRSIRTNKSEGHGKA